MLSIVTRQANGYDIQINMGIPCHRQCDVCPQHNVNNRHFLFGGLLHCLQKKGFPCLFQRPQTWDQHEKWNENFVKDFIPESVNRPVEDCWQDWAQGSIQLRHTRSSARRTSALRTATLLSTSLKASRATTKPLLEIHQSAMPGRLRYIALEARQHPLCRRN